MTYRPNFTVLSTGSIVTTGTSVPFPSGQFVLILRKSTGSATTVTLPASPVAWQIYTVKDGKGDAAANPITITPASGTIDGASSYVISRNYSSVELEYDGTAWNVIGGLVSSVSTPTGIANIFTVGINLSGPEGGNVPGVYSQDYTFPTNSEMDYFRGKGITRIRLPFRWERMQPTLGGALNSAYIGYVASTVAYAGAHGMTVLLDCHNGCRYGNYVLGDGNLTAAHHADLWTRIATAFAGTGGYGLTGLAGYDIQNEPYNLPGGQASWQAAAQTIISAIRNVDTITPIYVEGYGFSAAHQWLDNNNGNLYQLSDPSNRLVFSAHCYLDRDNSGTHYTWSDEVANGVTTQIGPQRLKVFTDWCALHGVAGHIGELGYGSDNGTDTTDQGWFDAGNNALAFLQSCNIPLTIWNAGPWITGAYSLEPLPDGTDTPQMAVATKYTGAPQPTTYAITGPQRGTASTASTAFRITYKGYLTTGATITLSDGGAGGTFSPSNTIALSGTFNPSGTFTYTAPGSATYSITATNNKGWTNPPALGYSTRVDPFATAAIAPRNVLSLRRAYTAYSGPLVKLRRANDNALQDFGVATGTDNLDVSAISAWAGGNNVYVATWYDQSPNANHAGPVTAETQGDTGSSYSSATVNSDQPQLILNAQNGRPIVRFAYSRMDMFSPIDGLTGQSIFTVYKPASGEVGWHYMSWFHTDNNETLFNSSGWNINNETPTQVPVVLDSSAFHVYGTRYRASTATNGRQVYKDGTNTASAASTTSSILFHNRNYVNLGFNRFSQGYCLGDSAEIIIFPGALTDSDMTAFQANMKTAWATP